MVVTIGFVALLSCAAASPVVEAANAEYLKASKKAFTLGRKAYQRGRYRTALDHFKRALTLAERASIHFNIAQSYRQLGERQKALKHYEKFLQTWRSQHGKKRPPYQAEVARHIKQLKSDIAAEAATPAPPPPPAEPPKPDLTMKPRFEEAAATQAIVRSEPDLTTEAAVATASESTPFYRTWWFWTAVSVAVAGAAAGTAVALTMGDDDPIQGTLPPGGFQF